MVSSVIILGTAFGCSGEPGGEKNWLEGMQENEHHHHDETRLIDTGHGKVELSILKKDNFPTGGYALLVAKDGLLKISH